MSKYVILTEFFVTVYDCPVSSVWLERYLDMVKAVGSSPTPGIVQKMRVRCSVTKHARLLPTIGGQAGIASRISVSS